MDPYGDLLEEIVMQRGRRRRELYCSRPRVESIPKKVISSMVVVEYDGGNEPELILVLESKNKSCVRFCWGFPGGGIDGEESQENAGQRELEEETGLSFNITEKDLVAELPVSDDDDRSRTAYVSVYYIFLRKRLQLRPGPDQLKAIWASFSFIDRIIDGQDEYPMFFNHQRILDFLKHQRIFRFQRS